MAAGTFHLVMEYRPRSIVIGRLVTFAAVIVTIWLVAKSWRKRGESDVPDPGSAPRVA
jgi:hypothetical protein